MKKILCLALASLLFATACNKAEKKAEPAQSATQQQAQNTPPPPPPPPAAPSAEEVKAGIDKYIADKGLKNVKTTPSGMYYIVEKAGKKDIGKGDKVKAHYTGTLLDGTKFDSSVDRGQPLEFPLGGVIPGWQEGIPLLKVGGKGKLIIPSNLAYGPRAMGNIPAYSTLVFDVEVLDSAPAN